MEQLDPNTERQFLKAAALLDEFGDDDRTRRLARSIVTLFLAGGERDSAGRRRLDIDAALASVAIGITLFLRALRSPDVEVELNATVGDTIAVYRGPPAGKTQLM